MAGIQSIGEASERVMAALVSGLAQEFGREVGEALAQRFLDAEEGDFHWEARVSERWLGTYDRSGEDDEIELDRVAILGRLDGEWFVAVCIVDGDGCPHGLIGRRSFASERAARRAYADAR